MSPKQLDLGNLSQAEKDERLAAAVTSYGVGTRSYNHGAEKKELDRQRAHETEKYLQGPRREIIVGPICRCRSFNLPHDISRHRELRSEHDWRTESERRGVEYYQERIR